jgi:hypothetical protein
VHDRDEMMREFVLETLRELKAQVAKINKRIEYLTILATTLATTEEPGDASVGLSGYL